MTTWVRKMVEDIPPCFLPTLQQDKGQLALTAAIQYLQNQWILLHLQMQWVIKTNPLLLSHCFGVETVCVDQFLELLRATDRLLVMAMHHFVLNREHSASIAHLPLKNNNNTERPLNTWKYSNTRHPVGHRQYLWNEGEITLLNQADILLLSNTMIWRISTVIMIKSMKSNTDSNNHNSRSNSYKVWVWWYGLWRGSSIPYGSAFRSPSGPAQQIHTSHEG